MSGRVLEFNIATASGLISGADGVRYPFAGQEWRSPSAMPQAGMNVDFESDGRAAYGVFVLTEAASASPAGSGFYRSSDNKSLGGVCGGLAHKWGSNPVLLRIIALFVPVGIPIYIVMWLSLAERPTGK